MQDPQLKSPSPASFSGASRDAADSFWSILLVFLRLGLTSFGGPIAHLGYFRDELVVRRKWLSEESYADLVALCQFLPGPASSQVGFSLGVLRGKGIMGGIAAWIGFPVTKKAGMAALALFAVLLLGVPLLAAVLGDPDLALFDAFYRSGALVFGGGHVVLPLLQARNGGNRLGFE